MFNKLFKYNNPEEYEQDLMKADTEQDYNKILNDINIKQTFFRSN